MAKKPKNKRKLFWSVISGIITLVLVVLLVPPMITLNSLKPIIEKSIHEQTAVPLKLNGDIHFSLIGGTTIVAHDVSIPTAQIGSVLFSIPLRNFFNLAKTHLNGPVVIYDADIQIENLAPASFNHNIEIYNSDITFHGQKFKIVRADFTDGEFHGVIRSNEHKYEVEFIGDTFQIKNKNNNLTIRGQIFSDGSIRGRMSIETTNINQWFGFAEPQIKQLIKMTTNFEWDGHNGYKFSNINSDKFYGNIDVYPDGKKTIQLVSDDANFDFSFLLKPSAWLTHTNLNLDFYGNIKFGPYEFKHLKINTQGSQDKIQITNIIADNITISGGYIDTNGAHDVMINAPFNNNYATCLFSGTPEKWSCKQFDYKNLSGFISTDNNKFNIAIKSQLPLPVAKPELEKISKLGTHGTIEFEFSDIAGTYYITPTKTSISYKYAKNKTLSWLKLHIPYLPEKMLEEYGDFSWHDGTLTFIPYNKQWQISVYDNYFTLNCNSYKQWIKDIDLRFVQDGKVTISGYYTDNSISNLKIDILGNEFSGALSGNSITLHTEKFALDSFLNQSFFNRFSELEFLTNEPILTLFDIPVKVSLSADVLTHKDYAYKNFTYSLKPNNQTFSISDTTHGNILVTIDKDKSSYEIFAQLNKFKTNGKLLSANMPLNIRDTYITGELALTTYGKIAHDIYYNISGTLDLTFTNGYLLGMSFDNFYASADNITTLNAESALASTLTQGETKIKQMRVIGEYSNDNFITTSPVELTMRHTDAIGGIAIQDGKMTAEFDLTLRGTAPTPVTIELGILPDGGRKYSLSEIMQNLDTGFMRAFVKTHNKF